MVEWVVVEVVGVARIVYEREEREKGASGEQKESLLMLNEEFDDQS